MTYDSPFTFSMPNKIIITYHLGEKSIKNFSKNLKTNPNFIISCLPDFEAINTSNRQYPLKCN